MKTLKIQIPDSVDVEEEILGRSMGLPVDSIIVSEALAKVLLGMLEVTVTLPEDCMLQVDQPGETCMASIVFEEEYPRG